MSMTFACDNPECRSIARKPDEVLRYMAHSRGQGGGALHSCSEPCDVAVTKALRKAMREADAAVKFGIVGPNGEPRRPQVPPADPALE